MCNFHSMPNMCIYTVNICSLANGFIVCVLLSLDAIYHILIPVNIYRYSYLFIYK